MANEKQVMRALRLVLSDTMRQRSGGDVDEHLVHEIKEAHLLMAQTKATDLVPAIVTIIAAGIPLAFNISPVVRRAGEKSPGQPGNFRKIDFRAVGSGS